MTHRALITGAAGFAGHVLADRLREQGWQVLRGALPEEIARGRRSEGWHPCDLGDPVQIDALMRWAQSATHVFHLAAVTFVPEAERDPATTFSVNLNGTVRLIEAMRRHAPGARFVNIASSEVYGHPQGLPVDETHPLDPVNPYAISKAAGDLYCAYAHNGEGVDCVRMRPFNHTGPGQSDRFVLSSFARQIADIEAGRHPPVLKVGNLEASRDFLHVRDVVRAYEMAALDGRSGDAYNVCSGVAVRIGDALERLCALSSVPIAIEADAERLRAVDVPLAYGSHEKLTADTGWRPEIPFDAVLSDLLAYWRNVEQR